MKKRLIIAITLVIVSFFSGCGNDNQKYNEIDSFILSHNFPEFEKFQKPDISGRFENFEINPNFENLIVHERVLNEENNAILFIVGFKDGHAMGLSNNNKLGWLLVDGEYFEENQISYYDFDSSDTYIYSGEFINDYKDAFNEDLIDYDLLELILADEDIPLSFINIIINERLIREDHNNFYRFEYAPSLINLVLDNPNVQKDKEILSMFSRVQVMNVEFQKIRLKALNLYEKLEPYIYDKDKKVTSEDYERVLTLNPYSANTYLNNFAKSYEAKLNEGTDLIESATYYYFETNEFGYVLAKYKFSFEPSMRTYLHNPITLKEWKEFENAEDQEEYFFDRIRLYKIDTHLIRKDNFETEVLGKDLLEND